MKSFIVFGLFVFAIVTVTAWPCYNDLHGDCVSQNSKCQGSGKSVCDRSINTCRCSECTKATDCASKECPNQERYCHGNLCHCHEEVECQTDANCGCKVGPFCENGHCHGPITC